MSRRSRRAHWLGVTGAAMLVAGVVAIVIAALAQRSAPQPSAAAARPVNVIPADPSAGQFRRSDRARHADTLTTQGPLLPRSNPVQLRIPKIGVNTPIKHIGLNDAGQISTPPLVHDSHAYWLTVSPTPGELGPATIIGHVDSATSGPGVFFRLGDLRQRDTIDITRADGTIAEFQVEHVDEYKKDHFPTAKVYGNIDHAGLRLITCGGAFNAAIGSYNSNIVVYAALVTVMHAR